MMLEDGWMGRRGGKLPGVFGGAGPLAYSCSGGRQEDRCECFNLRPMWRQNNTAELYTYLPLTESNTTQLLKVPPQGEENKDYGISVGRGSFSWDVAVGQWASVAFRVRLNDVGSTDGEVQIFINGESVIHADGLEIITNPEAGLKGMHFQTFFGGHTEEWASPRDQRAWFADVSAVIVE